MNERIVNYFETPFTLSSQGPSSPIHKFRADVEGVNIEAVSIFNPEQNDLQANMVFSRRDGLGGVMIKSAKKKGGLANYPEFNRLNTNLGADMSPHNSRPFFVMRGGYLSNQNNPKLRNYATVVYQPIEDTLPIHVWISGIGVVHVTNNRGNYGFNLAQSGDVIDHAGFKKINGRNIRIQEDDHIAYLTVHIKREELRGVTTELQGELLMEINFPLEGASPYEVIEKYGFAHGDDRFWQVKQDLVNLGFLSLIRSASQDEAQDIAFSDSFSDINW